jgi:CDGSH-type Zn-finger protein
MFRGVALSSHSVSAAPAVRSQQSQVRVGVRAEVETTTNPAHINQSIRKDSDKVVDTVQAGELTKPLTAYCRCWRSETFPLCNGAHAKHNKETGDNVGPLLLKK